MPAAGADEAADAAHQDRLDQELAQDVAVLGADGFAHADLARALGDRHQHDVHDADAAHQQGDAGDAAQQDVEGVAHGRTRSRAFRPGCGCRSRRRASAGCGAVCARAR